MNTVQTAIVAAHLSNNCAHSNGHSCTCTSEYAAASSTSAPWNHEWEPDPHNHQNDYGLASDDNWPFTT